MIRYLTVETRDSLQHFCRRLPNHEILFSCLPQGLPELWVHAMGVKCLLASISARLYVSTIKDI